jgi:hypothetical protein
MYIHDQQENFPNDEQTIDCIRLLMDEYAAAWHNQLSKGTLNGIHPKWQTGYILALKIRLQDKCANDEAHATLENVRFDGYIRVIFTQIQMHYNKAFATGAVLKNIILDQLPYTTLEQMHTVDLSGKTDDKIISIIANAGRTAEKWEEACKHLGLRKPISEVPNKTQNKSRFNK